MRLTITGTDVVAKRIDALPDKIKQGVAIIAERIFDRAIEGAESHRKTGALVRSLGTNPIKIKGGYSIRSSGEIAPHNVFVHFGRQGRIYPRKKKALRFAVNGVFIFAKSVRGYKGDPFIFRAADSVANEIDDIFSGVLKDA